MEFIFYSQKEISHLTRKRKGETKLGEKVQTIHPVIDLYSQLQNCNSKFVLFGIPEDIGVRANLGRGGAHTCWQPSLESFLNTQDNAFLNGEETCVLGHVKVEDVMKESEGFSQKKEEDILGLRKLVEKIDDRVCEIVRIIVSAGKIPIVIGGGHNNSYPILKGIYESRRIGNIGEIQKQAVINCDAHSDLREKEGRHSGNGFSYAMLEKYLDKYAVMGIHESYNSENVIEKFQNEPEKLLYVSYEDIFIREKYSFSEAVNRGIEFCGSMATGLEIDLDSITNVPSSARTSSGISPVQARQYIHQAATKCNISYLHIAEGAPVLAHLKADNKTGKLVAYLISDFIKAIMGKRP